MRYPQLIIHEPDGTVARGLRELVEKERWVLRQPKRIDSGIRLLAGGQPCVLVLRAGRDMTREMTLLERSRRLAPETPVVVITEPENVALNGLAWHLGASCVLGPKQTRDTLPGVITGLMKRASGHGTRLEPEDVPGAPSASPRGIPPEDDADD
jgi:hypothetical protein